MDLRSGVVSVKRVDYEADGACAPDTPAKTMRDKLAYPANGGGNNSTVPYWFIPADGFSDGGDGTTAFAGRVVGTGGDRTAATVLGSRIYSSDVNVATRAQSTEETVEGWLQTSYTNLTACVNSAAATSDAAAFFPMFPGGYPMSIGEKADAQLMLKGKITRSNAPLDDAHSKLAVCEMAAPSIAPITPEKHLVGKNGHSGRMDSIEKGKVTSVTFEESNFIPFLNSSQKGPLQMCFDKGTMEQAELVPVRLSSDLQESKANEEVENQGIGNKTPMQRPRRKKHRPKVIREGKPSRTPRSSTPKPATPVPATAGENKRKNTRRKGLNSPLETPQSVENGKDIEDNKRKRARSAKRHLDFSAEDNTAEGAYKCNTNTRSQEQSESLSEMGTSYTYKNCNGHGDSIIKLKVSSISSQGVETLLDPFNNHLETYLSSLDIPSLFLQPSRRELVRENLKKLARRRDIQQVQRHYGHQQSEMQDDAKFTFEDKLTTIMSNLPSTEQSTRINGWNVDGDLFIGGTQLHNVNVIQADLDYENTCYHGRVKMSNQHLAQGIKNLLHFHEIQNRRVDIEHNELTFREVASFVDPERILKLEKMRALEAKQAFGQIKVDRLKSPMAPAQACYLAIPRENIRYDQFLLTPENTNLKGGIHDNDTTQKPTKCGKSLKATAHPDARGKRQKKNEEIKVASSVFLHMNHLGRQEEDNATCNLLQNSSTSVSSSETNYKPNGLEFNTSVCNGTSTFQQMHGASSFTLLHPGGSEILLSLDQVIQKMKYLNINDQGNNVMQEQTALVPYDANGAIVPFEGEFLPTKKLRHRAKIVLDEETNRVWNLLMGKESGVGIEGVAADKEGWWEEERSIFHGRANSFIAKMHLVQGDRRFSPWKGSVLDSVIGVFLTQNVSDHLSSSAFMALAARFPPQPSRVMHMSTEQGTLDEDNHVAGNHSDKAVYNKISDINHEAERMGEKEVHTSEMESRGDMFLSPRDKDSVDASLKTLQDSNVIKVTGKKSLGYTQSSQDSIVSSQSSTGDICIGTDQIDSIQEANSKAENLITSRQCAKVPKNSFLKLLEMAESSSFPDLQLGKEVFSGTEISRFTCKENFNDSLENNHNYAQPSGKEVFYSSESIASGTNRMSQVEISFPEVGPSEITTEISHHQDSLSSLLTSLSSPLGHFKAFTGNLNAQRSLASTTKAMHPRPLCCQNGNPILTTEFLTNGVLCPGAQDDILVENQQKTRGVSCFADIENASLIPSQIHNHKDHECYSVSPTKQVHNSGGYFIMADNKSVSDKGVESNSAGEVSSSFKQPKESADSQKRKRGKLEAFDWDSLRRQVHDNGAKTERSSDTMDSLDWEAVRNADVSEISNTIRERGMNNKLAERIKGFLDRLVKEHGSIDLEWLRDVPPDKAKEFLLSIRGLGLKSVECVRLLTLHHLAFPVDTNVGRICVRLGWVPLQPLPESLQLHLLELYPMLETIQKYLWPRLCTLDQRTLYELHYQMITFGKVFCTKSKPNCNACPLRGECRHFASAFASARLALPGPEDKSIVNLSMGDNHKALANPKALNQLEGISLLQEVREPIIEEPPTPEPEYTQIPDIEDAFYEDPDEIPTIKLNIEEFAQNLQSYMQENDMEIHDVNLSKALVAITPEAASIPVPKLKNVSRLRTEHQVYELPDSHPLLEGLDQREAHDPSPYLLAIWTPGETAQSTEPPESCSNTHGTGSLCDERTCFSCSSIREAQAQTVRGTLLIPCRTAMRGSFPLNGTYFQVNEVFADHESSLTPINVPRGLIWNLPRRTVYFGTSVPTIFKGLAIEAIQNCFWRGFVCVRGFDRKTRRPRPLMARLHFPLSKAVRNKRSAAE